MYHDQQHSVKMSDKKTRQKVKKKLEFKKVDSNSVLHEKKDEWFQTEQVNQKSKFFWSNWKSLGYPRIDNPCNYKPISTINNIQNSHIKEESNRKASLSKQEKQGAQDLRKSIDDNNKIQGKIVQNASRNCSPKLESRPSFSIKASSQKWSPKYDNEVQNENENNKIKVLHSKIDYLTNELLQTKIEFLNMSKMSKSKK